MSLAGGAESECSGAAGQAGGALNQLDRDDYGATG